MSPPTCGNVEPRLSAVATRGAPRPAPAAGRAGLPTWCGPRAPPRRRAPAKAPGLLYHPKRAAARLTAPEEGSALKDPLGAVLKSVNILEFMAGDARRL